MKLNKKLQEVDTVSWYEDDNANNVTREHFELAIRQAEECKPEHPGKIAPKVGVVVVKNGKAIIESHRNQTGSGDHAEFIAMEQRGVDKVDFSGADLITTLEPCTEKRHGEVKKACADWIRLRRIRKVWIGALDRNLHVRGKAVLMFHDLGIHVGWFPDDLIPKILKQNEEFFEFAQMMTPQLSEYDLEERRMEIRDLVQHELSSYKEEFRTLKRTIQGRPDRTLVVFGVDLDLENFQEKEKIIDFAQIPIDAMQESLSRLMGMNPYDVGDWNKIGSKLLLAHEVGSIVFRGIQNLPIQSNELSLILDRMKESSGIVMNNMFFSGFSGEALGDAPAVRAFDTATKLDGTNADAAIGKTTLDIFMSEYERAFNYLENVRDYLSKPNQEVAVIYREIGRNMRNEGISQWRLAYTRAVEFETN